MSNTTNLYGAMPDTEQDASKVATYNGLAILFDNSVAGELDISTTGGTTTLTGTPIAPQSQHAWLKVTGVLASNAIIEYPVAAGTGRPRILFVSNQTSGAFTVKIRAVGQTGVVITQGKSCFYYFNGTDYLKATAEI